jgi:hypothetical protein
MLFDEIHFFNPCNKGDIHSSRGVIKNIIRTYPNLKIFYHHKHGHKLLKDMPIIYTNENCELRDISSVTDNKLYINTWLGQKRNDGVQFCSTWGCNCISNKELLNHILNLLDKNILEFNEFDVLPTIDYTGFNIKNINEYVKNNTKNKVLICNGPVLSGQCFNFSFVPFVTNLAEMFPNIEFILTQKHEFINKDNIKYTDDIIQENECDLNEVSYLSTYCPIVIGRASGPWTFAQTVETLTNKHKTFISFNNNREDAFFTEKTVCNKIWSNDYSPSNIMNILVTEVSKL